MQDLDLYKKLQEFIRQGKHAVLATVVEAVGAVPRSAGAKMLVFEDGSSLGTVGGGCVEEKVRARVKEMATEETCCVLKVELLGKPGQIGNDVCGGVMKIMMERV